MAGNAENVTKENWGGGVLAAILTQDMSALSRGAMAATSSLVLGMN
jgi:hypothetical protein